MTNIISNYEENKADPVRDPLAKVLYMKDMMQSGGRMCFFLRIKEDQAPELVLKNSFKKRWKAVMSFLLAF